MRRRLLASAPALAALLLISACKGGTSHSPAAPSASITVAQTPAASGPSLGASSVSWSCFSRVGTGGTFGVSGCPTARVTLRALAASAPIVAPQAPSGLSATVTGSTVTLTWTAPAGGDPPSSYIVQAGSSSGLSDLASFDTGGTATTLAVLNVPAGTYYVRVRGNNSAGASAPSNEFLLVVAGASPCGSLSAPTGLAASVTGNTVVLTWSTPAGCAPTNYVVQAGSAPGLSNLANFSTGSTATTFTAAGVAPGTYYLRVLSAAGAVLSAPSTEIAFAVGGCGTSPSAPTNLRAAVTGSTVALAWDAPAGACAATSYLLQAGSATGRSDLANSPVTGTALTAVGVGNGTYYVRVIAINAVGQSGPSNEIVFTVGPVAPTTLAASFQLIDPATQPGPTTECRIRGQAGQSSTCRLNSTSFTFGANTIVSYTWSVQYTYDIVKTINATGPSPTLAITDICGLNQSTADGAAQPLSVTLTVTDNLGATATATSGVGSQPALQLRLYTCGS
jgi:predicted phage tail protein